MLNDNAVFNESLINFYILSVTYSYGNSLFKLIYLSINFSIMLFLMLLSSETHFKKVYMLIYLFILVAIFIRNLLLYFTYFIDDYIYYHFILH